jgi:hypothetical protein
MLQVLRQLRRTMLFMQHSELSTFDNADMVKSCRDIGMHKSIELQNDTTEFFQRLLERLETEGTHVTHFTTCAASTKVQIPTQNCLGSVGLDAQVGAALLPRAQAK